MDLNIALDNFKRAYNDLIDALETEKPKHNPNEKEFLVMTDIGNHFYFAKNRDHAKNKFRLEHGYNHIKIINVKEV